MTEPWRASGRKKGDPRDDSVGSVLLDGSMAVEPDLRAGYGDQPARVRTPTPAPYVTQPTGATPRK